MEICVIRGYGERNPHQVCGGTETTKVSFEYTVEGNTSTTVNGNSVRGVWQHQYPIGSGRILGYGMIS